MLTRLHVVTVLVLCLLATGCGRDERVGGVQCDLSETITFRGHAYDAVHPRSGSGRVQVRTGRQVGEGVAAHCPGQEAQHVQVYKVVGVSVREAVFAKPVYGLMHVRNTVR